MIKNLTILFIIFVSTVNFAYGSDIHSSRLMTSKVTFSGKVVKVSDGDTIQVMRSGKIVKVRLAEIDCPEKKQAFGKVATKFTRKMIAGARVTVAIKDIDRYGRTVGEVFLSDGRSLNRELLKAGLAWWYQRYSNDTSLGALEDTARTSKIGLWQDKNPIPPWEFRRMKRHNG